MRSLKNPEPSKIRSFRAALPRRMAGFIQGILLFGIALLAVVIAAFAFSNKSSSNSTKAEEAKTYASTILAQGNTIKTAVERFRLDRGGLFNGNTAGGLENLMDFSTNQFRGLYNTTDSFAVALTVQPRAYVNLQVPNVSPSATTVSAAGSYNLRIYHGTATSPISIGGSPVHHLLSTPGLTDDTCRRINVNLHGAGFSQGDIPTAAAGTRADFSSGIATTATGNITITMTDPSAAGTPINNLEEGCVRTTDTPAANVYFKVLNRIPQ